MKERMIQLKSAFIKAAGYFKVTLRIEMKNGRVYDLPHVPYELFVGLLRAQSHGTYFNQKLRGKFK